MMKEYIDSVSRCLEQCKEMLQLESEKRRALIKNAVHEIEEVVKKQQAALMKLETLEHQRIKAQVALGYDEAATAAQILADMPEGQQKDTLSALIVKLKECAVDLKEQNKDSLELARLDLQLVESLRAGSTETTAQSGVYSRSQTSKPINSSKFDGSF